MLSQVWNAWGKRLLRKIVMGGIEFTERARLVEPALRQTEFTNQSFLPAASRRSSALLPSKWLHHRESGKDKTLERHLLLHLCPGFITQKRQRDLDNKVLLCPFLTYSSNITSKHCTLCFWTILGSWWIVSPNGRYDSEERLPGYIIRRTLSLPSSVSSVLRKSERL